MITSRDVEAIILCKLGSGVNLLGYYMYTGGLQPIGKTALNEECCPVISYDFQAPIGDMGQLRESWLRLQDIHRFLHSFGEILAPMDPLMPSETPASLADRETLRCALRTNGSGGFLFVNNHVRIEELPAHPAQEFTFRFSDREVSFRIDIPAGSAFFMPVNLNLGGLHMLYASAMPLEYTENSLTLRQIPGIAPVLSLADGRTVCLTEGVNRIDGTDVILLMREEYVPTALTRIQAEPAENCCDAHILLDYLHKEDHTVEYIVRWSENDNWLVIRAHGYVGGFYVNNQLISDAFFNGDAWVIDLRNLSAREGRIKIQPLAAEELRITYFEAPMKTGIHTPEVWVSQEERLYI